MNKGTKKSSSNTCSGSFTFITAEYHGDELDARTLFLGPGCSRSFEVDRFDGFQGSMIYFLDDGLMSVCNTLNFDLI